jgi:hypothetical protein
VNERNGARGRPASRVRQPKSTPCVSCALVVRACVRECAAWEVIDGDECRIEWGHTEGGGDGRWIKEERRFKRREGARTDGAAHKKESGERRGEGEEKK